MSVLLQSVSLSFHAFGKVGFPGVNACQTRMRQSFTSGWRARTGPTQAGERVTKLTQAGRGSGSGQSSGEERGETGEWQWTSAAQKNDGLISLQGDSGKNQVALGTRVRGWFIFHMWSTEHLQQLLLPCYSLICFLLGEKGATWDYTHPEMPAGARALGMFLPCLLKQEKGWDPLFVFLT